MNTLNILAPISVGELIDKITILRIKQEKIRDDARQRHVTNELEQLVTLRGQSELDTLPLAALEDQLFEVNLRLWQVEDDLRESERRRSFGADFVALARLVYKLNDRRSALKKEINTVTGSAIVEEKFHTPYE